MNTRAEGRWKVRKRGKAPLPNGGRYQLQARCGEQGVSVYVNGISIGTFQLAGRGLGVCLENCNLQFTELRTR